MTNLIIGVTPRISKINDQDAIKVNRNYIDKLTKIGLNPIIICPNTNLDLILPICSGFLIIGGDDYDPSMYGQTNELGLSKGIDKEMDNLDKMILSFAKEHKVPVFGICRGHQAMSAVFGKALYQDIEQSKLSHPTNGKFHEVTKVNNVLLATRLPQSFITNTFHHQATKDLPNDFIILYKNHDVIEAIEHKSLPFISTQWHPERMDTKESDIIFSYFFELVETYAKNKENQ